MEREAYLGHCNRTLTWLCQFLRDVNPSDLPERLATKWAQNLLAYWPFEDLGIWLSYSSSHSFASAFFHGERLKPASRLELSSEGILANALRTGVAVVAEPEESLPLMFKDGDAPIRVLLMPIRGASRVKLGVVVATFSPETIPGGEFGALEFLKAAVVILGTLLEKFAEQNLRLESLKVQLKSLGGMLCNRNATLEPFLPDSCIVQKLASSGLPVLIVGESGTGKTTLARRLHELSQRKDEPFLVLDVENLPPEDVEEELFGSEGDPLRYGKLELACGGTLVLEGVGALPLGVQAKLVDLLEHKRFAKKDGQDVLDADVRIVGTAEHDLEQDLKEGRIRPELYYRLNAAKLHLLPLRERKSEAGRLVEGIVQSLSERYGQKKRPSKALLAFVARYPWPGNLRQLHAVLEYAFVMADEVVDLGHLPVEIQEAFQGKKRGSRKQVLMGAGRVKDEDFGEINRALARNRWVLSKAARELGITRRQLEYRVKKFNLWPKEES